MGLYNNFNIDSWEQMGCGATAGVSSPNPKTLKNRSGRSKLSRSFTKHEQKSLPKFERKEDIKKTAPP